MESILASLEYYREGEESGKKMDPKQLEKALNDECICMRDNMDDMIIDAYDKVDEIITQLGDNERLESKWEVKKRLDQKRLFSIEWFTHVVKLRHGQSIVSMCDSGRIRNMRFIEHCIRSDAGCEGAFMIGIVLDQIARNAIQAVLRDLRPARVVEEDGRTVQRGKLTADAVEVQGHMQTLLKRNLDTCELY
jgi:hypothetical protein